MNFCTLLGLCFDWHMKFISEYYSGREVTMEEMGRTVICGTINYTRSLKKIRYGVNGGSLLKHADKHGINTKALNCSEYAAQLFPHCATDQKLIACRLVPVHKPQFEYHCLRYYCQASGVVGGFHLEQALLSLWLTLFFSDSDLVLFLSRLFTSCSFSFFI